MHTQVDDLLLSNASSNGHHFGVLQQPFFWVYYNKKTCLMQAQQRYIMALVIYQ